ncbi:hypothetical protein [Actinomycetospora lemnae]|uniref:Uncharacterized protein n=1 Tax=Actinomycetospora lemnae TaxID=3019891 RepID=A0ABT5SSH4_9PSEU|nr:hypothetical protein [Actinomycetospora sp. DW7H6]MDD7965739.1 hypothetical protein [Actinomycetospora sp. DW7H6]
MTSEKHDATSESTGAGGNGPTNIPEESASSESELALSKQAARRDGDEDGE